ncbi:MAG: hypothetical protein Q8P39_02110 [Candidatus Yanofskybacteria bacterium]|nr:hypothetical protein [Candidatus Yanofskybacteria bacterium]
MNSPKLSLDKAQEELVLGSLLGDGSLEFNGYIGTRLQIKQSDEHQQYAQWTYTRLKQLCRTPIQQRRDTNQWYFSTRALKELTDWWRVFYRNGQKRVPENIAELGITPLSLAVWYMDDGSLDYRAKSHHSVILHTDSFHSREVDILRSMLWDKFQISARRFQSSCRGKTYQKLYIGSEGRERFFKLVSPYVQEGFPLKLSPVYTKI